MSGPIGSGTRAPGNAVVRSALGSAAPLSVRTLTRANTS